jgi:hypothetical protein
MELGRHTKGNHRRVRNRIQGNQEKQNQAKLPCQTDYSLAQGFNGDHGLFKGGGPRGGFEEMAVSPLGE